MCCRSKKKELSKPIPPASQVQIQPPHSTISQSSKAFKESITFPQQSNLQQPNFSSLSHTGRMSQLNASKIGNFSKNLEKSNVRVQGIDDPKIANFFVGARTEQLELQKITQEHTTYVRKQDYFDLSEGHQAELNELSGLPDKGVAMYGTSGSNELLTPSLHRFYYDRNVEDIGSLANSNQYELYTAYVKKNSISEQQFKNVNSNTQLPQRESFYSSQIDGRKQTSNSNLLNEYSDEHIQPQYHET